MTEAEWLASDDPIAMLEFLRGRVNDRKLRLYCCACCRRAWDRLPWNRRKAIEIAERYADGKAGWWGTFLGEMLSLPLNAHRTPAEAEYWAPHLAVQLWGRTPNMDGVAIAVATTRFTTADDPNAGAHQAHMLRDVCGPLLFRQIAVAAEWRTANALQLACTIYDERVYERMPILADALMDAGCTDDEMLQHCQIREPHIRGCWVLDLLLDRPGGFVVQHAGAEQHA